MNKKGRNGIRKRILIISAICVVVLAAEIALLAGVSRMGKKSKKNIPSPTNVTATPKAEPTVEPTETPAEPGDIPGESLVTVWRETEQVFKYWFNGVPTEYRLYTSEYDRDGNLLQRTRFEEDGTVAQSMKWGGYEAYHPAWRESFDSAGTLTQRIDYTYYENGLLKEEKVHQVDSDYSYKTLYQYDEDKRVIREEDYGGEPSVLIYAIDYEYNEKGLRVTSTWSSRSGEKTTVIRYAYDGAGRLIEEVNRNGDETRIESTHRIRYDETGRKTEETYYLRDDFLTWKEWFEYDADGRLTADIIDTSPEKPEIPYTDRYEFTYGTNGRLIRKVLLEYQEGTVTTASDICHDYDGNGCLAREESRDEEGNVLKETFYSYQSFDVPYSTLSEEEKEWYEREKMR